MSYVGPVGGGLAFRAQGDGFDPQPRMTYRHINVEEINVWSRTAVTSAMEISGGRNFTVVPHKPIARLDLGVTVSR